MGVANIASGFFGGLPATGAIARTATNIRAGGRSPMAGIFHALFLFVFTLVAGQWLALVPTTALAAVLLMVAWGMSEYHRFIALVRTDAGERGLLILTFLLTVFVDLTAATLRVGDRVVLGYDDLLDGSPLRVAWLARDTAPG